MHQCIISNIFKTHLHCSQVKLTSKMAQQAQEIVSLFINVWCPKTWAVIAISSTPGGVTKLVGNVISLGYSLASAHVGNLRDSWRIGNKVQTVYNFTLIGKVHPWIVPNTHWCYFKIKLAWKTMKTWMDEFSLQTETGSQHTGLVYTPADAV